MELGSILESVWKSANEVSGRHWVVASVGPALIFWGATGLVYYAVVFGLSQTMMWWDGLTSAQRSLSLFIAVVLVLVTAFIIDVAGTPMILLAQGYYLENVPLVGRALQQRWGRRFAQYYGQWEELSQKSMMRYHPELWKGRKEAKPLPITAEEEKMLAWLERFLHDIPPQGMHRPTRLGNILRAAESHSSECYGLDSVVVWPRLYPLLNEVLRRQIDDARTALDANVRMSFLAFTFSLIWGVEAILIQSWHLGVVAVIGLLSIEGIWRAALTTGAIYGELIRSAFDLHRFDLYRKLHLAMPANTRKEQQLGEKITLSFWRCGDMVYKHPKMQNDQD